MKTPQLAFALLAILLVVHVCVAVAAAPVAPAVARLMPLDGTWQPALDRADVGVKERWLTRDLFRRVRVPGDAFSPSVASRA
ncbi:MAG: hypothetical protein H7343_24130 [Undibacterium sp.]|nr:hypothetical protein [Opitutaceae bacterium]